jgi:phytoene synthase
MAFEIARNRELYVQAQAGVAMLPPRSARCVATALTLYSQILDRIEARGYDVFSDRARVPTWRKAVTAASIMVAGPRSTFPEPGSPTSPEVGSPTFPEAGSPTFPEPDEG